MIDFVFPGADEALRQDFARELSSAMVSMDSFTDAELFSLNTEEALKIGLDPLDLEMLTDQVLVADPAVEENFRLDRVDRL